jgi:hypothetical protein
MRSPTVIAVVVGVLIGATAAAAQSRPSTPEKGTPVELTGCVSSDPATSGSFTFVDATNGGKYRLTGKGVRKYAGQMVRLVGGPSSGKRFSVRGGLWPSPNVAAQAGAMDPAQAAIARQPGGTGGGTGSNDLPEFRVVSVRGVDGACR